MHIPVKNPLLVAWTSDSGVKNPAQWRQEPSLGHFSRLCIWWKARIYPTPQPRLSLSVKGLMYDVITRSLQRPIRVQHLPWFPAVNVETELTKSAAEASYEIVHEESTKCGYCTVHHPRISPHFQGPKISHPRPQKTLSNGPRTQKLPGKTCWAKDLKIFLSKPFLYL